MSRVELVGLDEMTVEQKAQYDRFPSNLSRGLLLAEGRLALSLPEVANALRASGFDARLREAVILRAAALSQSAYERLQHLDQAKALGWTEPEITAIEAGRLSDLPRDLAAILPFVDECVARPRVSDEALEAAGSVLDRRGLATLIILVGHYMTVARFTATLEIPLDPQPDPWTSEH